LRIFIETFSGTLDIIEEGGGNYVRDTDALQECCMEINSLNAELNPIGHPLPLLELTIFSTLAG
jgi:hypothetical protein